MDNGYGLKLPEKVFKHYFYKIIYAIFVIAILLALVTVFEKI